MSEQERKDFVAWAKSVPSCSEHARAEVMAYSWLAFKAGRAALAQQAEREPNPNVCANCGEPAPGCSGLFASDGKSCEFHGTGKEGA